MKSIVIYFSKTKNTKTIAEVIAKALQTKAIPLNLITKKGRGTEEEREKEKKFFSRALAAGKKADFIIIGTPTSFQKAHSKIMRFTRDVEAKNIALFCTYYNKVGTTLTDLKAMLKNRKINVVGSLEIGNLKPGQFKELDKPTQNKYIKRAKEFVKHCKSNLR